jgi:hypothetical protein
MTRKHFNALAANLRHAKPANPDQFLGWQAAVYAVCDACKAANPGFDRDRFMLACAG